MGSAAVGDQGLIRRLTEGPKGSYYNELSIVKRGAMEILSIQVGQPNSSGVDGAEDPLERPWMSALEKQPVWERVWLGPEGLG